jgi:hypothetical protein
MTHPSPAALAVLLALLAAACAPVPERPPVEVAAPGAVAAVPGPAEEQAQPAPGKRPLAGLDFPIVTRHAGVFNGQRVAYTATVDAIEVDDDAGKPGASIVSTSYVAEAPAPWSVRDVRIQQGRSRHRCIYMGAFGPKRVRSRTVSADPAATPVDNPHSIGRGGLVYRPGGTGFSRTVPGKALELLFGGRHALSRPPHSSRPAQRQRPRDSPPTSSASYGQPRGRDRRQLAELPQPVLLEGVVLFGQAVNIIEYAQRPNNIISYVVSLPTLAALGWYHGKAASGGAELESFVDSAWDYARTEYLQALFEGIES